MNNYFWEYDFTPWIGQVFYSYGIIPMETKNASKGTIQLTIGENAYEITNQTETFDYYGQEEDVAIFEIQEGHFEDCEMFSVKETIENIYLIKEKQEYFEDGHCLYENVLTRALILKTDKKEYCFEKEDVSFSPIIRIHIKKDTLSMFPKKNFWFEEEFFYGMESIQTKCTQEIVGVKEEPIQFCIKGDCLKKVNSFLKKHNHCPKESFLYTFGRNKIVVKCNCDELLELES